MGLLEASGYAVLGAANGAEALARLDAGEMIDVMVTDLTMPGMDGLSLIREARVHHPDLPAVLLTGYVDDGEALAAGGVEGAPFCVLRKPISGSQLADRIAALLEITAVA
jgi:CheY-like chemotaxis protein